MQRRKYFLWAMAMALFLGITVIRPAFADDDEHKNSGALINVIQKSKVSLLDGLHQAKKDQEVPISAKFELDEKGQLDLSVYTAEKGLKVGPQSNVFNELSGSAESPMWSPEKEVIKEGEDLTAAQEQLTVLSKGKISLTDIVEKAKHDYPGTIISAIPELEDGQLVCEIKVVNNGQMTEHHCDVETGSEVKMDDDDDLSVKEK